MTTDGLELYLTEGFLEMNLEKINSNVRKNSIGNYWLLQQGSKPGTVRTAPFYIGRSDTDLQQELIARVSTHPRAIYFVFWYKSSSINAYAKECYDYHNLQDLENIIHPAKPKGNSVIVCRICGN